MNADGGLLWRAGGMVETLPANVAAGYGLSDRNYPLGNLDGGKIAWIKRKTSNGTLVTPVQYDPVAFVPLASLAALPAGWATDHLMAPDTRTVQIGNATRGAESRPFLALPLGLALAVDANRDGQIRLATEDNSDATSGSIDSARR